MELQARVVCDSLKKEKKYEATFLAKVISQCELAHGLRQNLDGLQHREMMLSINSLLDGNIAIPFSMRLSVTERCVTHAFSELCATLKIKDAEQRSRQQKSMVNHIIRVIAAWDSPADQETWTFEKPCFSMLAAELGDSLQEAPIDSENAEQAETAQQTHLEAQGMLGEGCAHVAMQYL